MSSSTERTPPLRSGGTKRCGHLDEVETCNYGLLRKTCLGCGAVQVTYQEPGDPGMLFKVPSLAER